MRTLILIFLLTLFSLPGYSQLSRLDEIGSTNSSSGSDGSSICLTPEEWAALEDQIWAETQKTVEEAVKAAVIPYMAVIEKRDCQIKGLRTTLVVTVGISAVCLGAWCLMSIVR
jgi:hypothetical protein